MIFAADREAGGVDGAASPFTQMCAGFAGHFLKFGRVDIKDDAAHRALAACAVRHQIEVSGFLHRSIPTISNKFETNPRLGICPTATPNA